MKTQLHLDVRSVEPKDRYEQIMGAYESLSVGETLKLVVDHDPRCMYYTLRATRGEDAFSFEYIEKGCVQLRIYREGAGNLARRRGQTH